MGWMHDTLAYMQLDPVHRRFHHNALTFRGLYAFHENFVLPSATTRSSTARAPCSTRWRGTTGRSGPNLRLLYANQWFAPRQEAPLMGGEFGQLREWATNPAWTGTSPLTRRTPEIKAVRLDLNGVMRRKARCTS